MYLSGVPTEKRIGVLTSGGDAPGMNACIRAAVRRALADEERGLGRLHLAIDDDALAHLVTIGGGDARMALTGLEAATLAAIIRAPSRNDPVANPDGRDRYVHWFRNTMGPSPTPIPPPGSTGSRGRVGG